MKARCKTFRASNGADLEDEFNDWYASIDEIVIVQSHLAQIEHGVMLVVFYTSIPMMQQEASKQ